MRAEVIVIDAEGSQSWPAASPQSSAPGLGSAWIAILLLGWLFVGWGASTLDLNATESRLGIAVAENLGPYGQLFGRWDPSVWVGRVAISKAFDFSGADWPTPRAIRWPGAIAALLIGVILANSAGASLGRGAAIWTAICWFGCAAVMDRSSEFSLALFSGLRVRWGLESPDLVVGLMVIAAIDRILRRGSDGVAGLWAAGAMLTGGWPGVLLIVLSTLVIGRKGAMPSVKLIAPPLLALAVWSAWALSVADHRAWFTAMVGPIRPMPDLQRAATLQNLLMSIAILGLPWLPLAALAALPKIREGWSESGRQWVMGWLQASGACLAIAAIPALAFGIPGVCEAAKAPILAGLAATSAASAYRLLAFDWRDPESRRVLGVGLGVCSAVAAAWLAVMTPWTFYLSLAIPYYRGVMIALLLIGGSIAALTITSLVQKRVGLGLGALFLTAVAAKAMHAEYYAPEWNYRLSQGSWGRAIGQWAPPNWPIYAIGISSNKWPADLAFSAERSFRQLDYPQHLRHADGAGPGLPKFVLLHPAEFEHWPEDAPKLIEVRRFYDQMGFAPVRVLARTEGEPGWRKRSRPLESNR